MHILISGGTGFVGRALTETLLQKGHMISIASRSPNRPSNHPHVSYISYDRLHTLKAVNVIINVAGESLFGYWTKKKKDAIRSSRIETTNTPDSFHGKRQISPNNIHFWICCWNLWDVRPHHIYRRDNQLR